MQYSIAGEIQLGSATGSHDLRTAASTGPAFTLSLQSQPVRLITVGGQGWQSWDIWGTMKFSLAHLQHEEKLVDQDEGFWGYR